MEDPWKDEDELYLAGVGEQLWSNHSLDQQPPPPEPAIDALADELEINRLLEMKVLFSPQSLMALCRASLQPSLFETGARKFTLGLEIDVSVGCAEADW